MAPSHVKKALQYARDVASGKIPNCEWVKLAVGRHLRDLEREEDPDFPFYFDVRAAEAFCEFAEALPHVKGKWAKNHELLTLGAWQCFIGCCLFGWKRKRNGTRRFRKAYLKIPRKNGKSVLAAVIGLYMWCMDDEFGAEVYSGATTENQAWEVFRPAKQMLERCTALQEFAAAEVWAKSLVSLKDESRFEPIIGDPGDGASPSCSIHDEFHEHDTPNQVDTMETGMGAREQPLQLLITTAGYNIAGPCYDLELDCRHVLQGVTDNDELFCIMFGIDEPDAEGKNGDDWATPAALIKANPNFDVSVNADFLLAQQRQAVFNPIQQNKFKTKHLNIWCSARVAWMPMQAWKLCTDDMLNIDEFLGEPYWAILDLASKDDIASYGKLFRRTLNDRPHYYYFAQYYIPEEKLHEPGPNNAHYNKWHKLGLIHATDGAEIDFGTIREDVLADKSRFQLQELLYDPWRATQLAQEFREENVTTVEIRQRVEVLSAPMKEVLSAVRGSRMHHDGNSVTTWMVANVTAKMDAKDNIYPRKEKPEQKIDGAVTLIMGMSRAMVMPESGSIDDFLNDPVKA